MMLSQMSHQYADAAALLSRRMAELRAQSRTISDAEARRTLQRRMSDLTPLLRQCRELQALTAHYYDKSRNGKYTV